MIKAAFFNENGQSSIDRVFSPALKERIGKNAQVVGLYSSAVLAEKADELKDVEVIFSTWGMSPLTCQEIKTYLPRLKAVFYGAGTVQKFAKEFLDAGVVVTSSWAANAVPVAEYAHAQILLANKGFFTTLNAQRHPGTSQNRDLFPGNYGAKVGLLGAGMIGTMVIERLRQNDVEVFVFDPFMSEERAKALGVTKCDLKTIFSSCQTISNHLANKEEIRGILNKGLFSLMSDTACFINTGRGAQVNEDDLCDAMETHPLRSAVLDVTFPEPPVPPSRLLTLPNVFLTPHIAGSRGNETERMGRYAVDEFERMIRGERLLYSVDYERLKTMA